MVSSAYFFQEDVSSPSSDDEYYDGKAWLHQLVEKDDIDALRENAGDITPSLANEVTSQGYTPLMLAKGKEVVQFLISHGADAMLITTHEGYQNCAIMEYCEHGHISALGGLLEAFNDRPSEKNALVNTVLSNGDTPLQVAERLEHQQIADLLLHHRAQRQPAVAEDSVSGLTSDTSPSLVP